MIGVKNKLLIRICLFLSIFGFIFQTTQAQDKFHRLYPAQNDNERLYLLDAIQLKNGNYVALQQNRIFNPVDGKVAHHIVVSSLKPKGDVIWSFEISDSLKQVAPFNGSIVQGQNDSIYFNAGNLIGSLDNNGKVGNVVYKNVANFTFHNSHLVNLNKSILNVGLTTNTTGIKDIVLSRLSYNNRALWSKTLIIDDSKLSNKELTVNSIKINQDSSLLLCGVVDSTHSYVSVLDTFGNVKWSRTYSDTENKKSIPFISDGIQLADSSFILVGSVREFGVTNAVSDLRGLILKLNKSGQILWSKKVQFDNVDQTQLDEIVLDKSGDILIAGQNSDISDNMNFPFMIKINGKGDIIWKSKYKAQILPIFGSSVFITKDGGAALFNTAIDDNKLVTSFIKIDNSGSSSCELPISENILIDASLKSDTLKWTLKEFQLIDSAVLLKAKPHLFEVPVLSLAVRPFCPNEPIDWTFDASVQGATSYLWNDNSTADTLRVFAEGEYSVMVKIDEDVCYTLCDTAKLERYTKPQAQINLSLGNFCTNGKQTLSLGYQPGHPQVKSITWSTGESGASIEIATPGTYRVTVVDQCDETATALINVGPFPQKLSAASITGDPKANCFGSGKISGLLTASGNAVGLGELKYLWSTGATTAVISLNDSEVLTYTVTVTDICGTSATATKVVELNGGGTNNVTINANESQKCTEGVVGLNAITSIFSSNLKYVWSNGANTANNTVKSAGTYTVTVTDVCGNTSTASREVKFDFSDLSNQYRIDTISADTCKPLTLIVNKGAMFNLELVYKWSNGSSTRETSVLKSGTYTVTITSRFCSGEVVKDRNVDSEDIIINDLVFAKIFFPDGTFTPGQMIDSTTLKSEDYKNAEQYNRTFGPVNQRKYCIPDITEYELHVFNRWGQEVFVSDDIFKEWDGTYQDQQAPTESYLWIAKYKIFGIEKTVKGSVTMIRR